MVAIMSQKRQLEKSYSNEEWMKLLFLLYYIWIIKSGLHINTLCISKTCVGFYCASEEKASSW